MKYELTAFMDLLEKKSMNGLIFLPFTSYKPTVNREQKIHK